VVNSSFLYFSASVKILPCNIGVYAAWAPYFRHSIRYGNSELSTIGATINLGRPSLVQWAHARSTRASAVRVRLRGGCSFSGSEEVRVWAITEYEYEYEYGWRTKDLIWEWEKKEEKGFGCFMSEWWRVLLTNPSPPECVITWNLKLSDQSSWEIFSSCF